MKTDSHLADNRITQCFARLRAQGQSAFIPFITAGDPDYQTSLDLLKGLPAAGADLIELGMPFSDPMADGPAIQASSLRALKGGHSMADSFAMIREFRKTNQTTPILLMGYYNPIFAMGCADFVHQALEAGADGLIIVDLPPEHDDELCDHAMAKGLVFVRLLTPATDEARMRRITAGQAGMIYYVSVTGITGTHSAPHLQIKAACRMIRKSTSLPIAVGFGIRSASQV
ncbi:MAG: tryptophan synthase subunit alpha, partial [Pseudomonadota bacterium]